MKDEDIWAELAKNDPHVQDDPDSTTLGDLPAQQVPYPTPFGVPVLAVEIIIGERRHKDVWLLWVAIVINVIAIGLDLWVGRWWMIPVNLVCILICLHARTLGRNLPEVRVTPPKHARSDTPDA